jgi:hypothetical protein
VGSVVSAVSAAVQRVENAAINAWENPKHGFEIKFGDPLAPTTLGFGRYNTTRALPEVPAEGPTQKSAPSAPALTVVTPTSIVSATSHTNNSI